MKQPSSFYARFGFPIVLLAVFLLPIIGLGARTAMRSNSNDVREWLPKEYGETAQYAWFQEHFGNEEFIVASWPGCTVEDDRLELLTRKLRIAAEADEPGQPKIFKRVISGSSLIDELAKPPLSLSADEVKQRFAGTLFGPDGKQTCVVVVLTPEAKRHLKHTVSMVRELGVQECGIPADQFYLGGPPVVNVAIDAASSRSLMQLAALSGVVGLVIAWWCFRALRLTFLIFFSGLYSAAASLAVVAMTGWSMNAILMTMAPLVYVAATSGAIHLSNNYRDAVHEKGREGAAGRAIRHAWVPLGLATSTTAVGLLSLLYSELKPIESFGLFSAIGVVISLFVLFLVLPSVLEIFPPKETRIGVATGEHNETGELPLSPGWQRFARTVIRHHGLVTVCALALLAVFGLGLRHVETSIKIMRFFSSEAKVVQDYQWLERHLASLVPMEVVVRIDENAPLSFLERVELVAEVQEKIESVHDVGSAISVANFTKDMPSRKNWPDVRWSTTRGTMSRRLESKLDRFEETNYLAVSGDEQLWRVSLRVGAMSNIDYGQFIHELEQQVHPVLEKQRARLEQEIAERRQELTSQIETLAAQETDLRSTGQTAELAQRTAEKKQLRRELAALTSLREQGVQATFTGMVPVVYKAQRSLLDGLLFGFGTDLALVVVAIVVLMRHWSSGILLTCTSIFPTTVVFGFMGWSGIIVDVGTVMTPSVALGVTIDDVVHFILWFKRGIEKGMDREDAVMLAYQGCARAMYQSWGVIGLGLSMFALSSFTPTQRFGALMVSLLSAGLIGNLFFLPALLAGPLGGIVARSVRARVEKKNRQHQAEAVHSRSPELAPASESLVRPDRRSVKT
jgi:predicted RND superfamily exporter protein